jgi:hypothetical protein
MNLSMFSIIQYLNVNLVFIVICNPLPKTPVHGCRGNNPITETAVLKDDVPPEKEAECSFAKQKTRLESFACPPDVQP